MDEVAAEPGEVPDYDRTDLALLDLANGLLPLGALVAAAGLV